MSKIALIFFGSVLSFSQLSLAQTQATALYVGDILAVSLTLDRNGYAGNIGQCEVNLTKTMKLFSDGEKPFYKVRIGGFVTQGAQHPNESLTLEFSFHARVALYSVRFDNQTETETVMVQSNRNNAAYSLILTHNGKPDGITELTLTPNVYTPSRLIQCFPPPSPQRQSK